MRRITIEDLFGTKGYTVEWATGFPLPYDQQDAMFYRNPSSSWVCTVKKADFQVDVYCDGDMRVKNLRNQELYTCGEQLIDAGITDDAKFMRAQEEDVIDISMNPWFDLYVQGEHIDDVSHEIQEAINSACAYVDEAVQNAHQIEEGLLDLSSL